MKFFYKTIVLSLVLLVSISFVLISLSPYKKGKRYPHRYLNASVYIKAKKEIVYHVFVALLVQNLPLYGHGPCQRI